MELLQEFTVEYRNKDIGISKSDKRKFIRLFASYVSMVVAVILFAIARNVPEPIALPLAVVSGIAVIVSTIMCIAVFASSPTPHPGKQKISDDIEALVSAAKEQESGIPDECLEWAGKKMFDSILQRRDMNLVDMHDDSSSAYVVDIDFDEGRVKEELEIPFATWWKDTMTSSQEKLNCPHVASCKLYMAKVPEYKQ